MHLLELHLQAFGPFTDCRLDLGGGAAGRGLHILHGPNEAGKSSALRALHGLLFGIPARTRDDFIHGARDLRIGARLQARDGRELYCYRRKGNKDTLLGQDQSPIPEQQLSAMLGGVDAATFRRLFGIDHHTLVSGGQELLAEHGAAANALFGAGIGQLNLRELSASLASSADALYRPQASKPVLNQELARYRDLERALKTAGLSARDWEDAERELTAATQALAEIAQEILAAETRRGLLERVRRTQPNLSRLDALGAELEAIGEVPSLPEDFSARRQQAELQMQQAGAQRASADIRLAHLREQTLGLVVAADVLAEADSIDAFGEALGSYRKAASDRPGLMAQRDALRAQAAQALADTRPEMSLEQAETLRPLRALRRGAQQLATEGAKARTALAHAQKARQGLQHQLDQREGALAALPAPAPSAALEEAVEAARRAGNLDELIAELSDELAQRTQEAERTLAAAGLWPGDMDGLCQAALPARSEIGDFIERQRGLHQAAERLAAEATETRAEQTRLSERLRALQLAGQIPTEAQLDAARARREHLWCRIKAHCFGSGSDTPAAPLEQAEETTAAPLPERFEASQSESDSIADRLRREAASVHEQAALQARLEQTRTQTTLLEQQIKENATESTAMDQEWEALWSSLGIRPRQPAAMRDWQLQVRPLIEQAGQRGQLARRLRRLTGERDRLARELTLALASIDALASQGPLLQPLLSPLVNRAERALERMRERAQERASLEASCQELRMRRESADTELAAAERALADWRADWQALLARLGLPGPRDAEAVAEEFERLDQLFSLLDRQAELDARIAAIDADARAFEQQARALLARLAPDLQERALEPALGELRQRLAREREVSTRRAEVRAQLQQVEAELTRIEAAEASARATLSELCRIADCPAPEALASVEARAARARDLRRECDALRETLHQAGDGRTLAELRAEAAALEPDALSAERDTLASQLDMDLRPRERAAIERKLKAHQALAAMDGGADAAELAAELARSRARIRRLSEQWLQRRFASRLLRDARDRFAERHRDPLLPLIAQYFSRLTEGAFSAVEIDFDQGEQPVLVARRDSGERLGVEALSTGTRDQLYLALRLAALEHRAKHAEPLPLFVDDILVQFDDRRSQASLAALADFSATTQVILFTHHRYVVEQALTLQAAAESSLDSQAWSPRMPILVHDLC